MSWAYYNEIDPFCCEWLRRLIASGLIAPGEVDERSIEDVRPEDLRGFTQCHFFAGIGVWSYALIGAGWPDDRPVWTGSCPCQPFSAAGKGAGFADERHLWPAWFYLIGECRPRVVFGEQVASKGGLAWLDVVQADLENAGYAVGALDQCAAGVGAPHIRQRLYFVADADHSRSQGWRRPELRERTDQCVARPSGSPSIVGHADDDGSRRHGRRLPRTESSAQGCVRSVADGAQLTSRTGALAHHHQARLSVERSAELLDGERSTLRHDTDGRSAHGALADDSGIRRQRREDSSRSVGEDQTERREGLSDAQRSGDARELADAYGRDTSTEGLQRGRQHGLVEKNGGFVRGFWRNAHWIACADGKARPVEPGTFPLAHGAPARVGRLRAYGNAIVAPLAQAFIEAYMKCRP